jgi:hypothetical protein
MSPAEAAALAPGDRILLALRSLQLAWIKENLSGMETEAHRLLDLAAHHPNEPLYGDAIYQANIALGKLALRHGNRGVSARYLMAAAQTPGSEPIYRGDFDMNLPRALVDWGERRAVIDFYRRMAPKTRRAPEFRMWANQLSKGLNPDLLPTFSTAACSNDPC